MDWRAEAIEKLQGYEARRADLERIPLELERLEDAYTGICAAKLDGMPRSGSGTREAAILSNIAHRDELRRKMKEAHLWICLVERGLSRLDDGERLVLELLFIHKAKGDIDRLCERLYVERSAVYRRRDEALRRFTMALYGAIESL